MRDPRIGVVTRLAGVSVRTLHHCDAIGLLVPNERCPAGERRYHRRDIERLQPNLAYRAPGLELGAVGCLLGDPARDAGSPAWNGCDAPCAPPWRPACTTWT